jgi:hypothetical protein
VAHLAGGLRRGHGRHGLLDGHVGVHPVQLEQVDALGAQVGEGFVDLRRDRGGAGVALELGDRELVDADLCGDDDALASAHGLSDQALVPLRPVGAGRVKETHAQLGGPAQEGETLRPVGVRAEVAGLAGQAHRAKAQAVHGEVTAQGEGGRVAGVLGHVEESFSR